MILLEPGEVDADGRAIVRDARSAHLRRVLKAEPGQTVCAGLLNGNLGRATVTAIGREGATLACEWDDPPPPRPGVDLLLAVPRPKALNRLWPQLAALGVDRIILTGADRVEPSYFDSHVLDPGRVRGRLIDGLQQARDTRLPEVAVHRRFDDAIESEPVVIGEKTLRIAADPRFDRPLAACRPDRPDRRVALAVGPEGGWSDRELEQLAARGFGGVSLGPRILRTDTACVALISWVMAVRAGA